MSVRIEIRRIIAVVLATIMLFYGILPEPIYAIDETGNDALDER